MRRADILGPFRRLDAHLKRCSANRILAYSLLLALGLGVLDYYVDPDLLVLYLIPIGMAGWYGNLRAAMVIAIYSASADFVTQALQRGEVVSGSSLWNLLVRLLTFAFIANLIGRLQESTRITKQLTEFIVHDLRSPISSSITGLQTLETMSEGMDDIQREMVGLALVSNQRALTLVNSILDVAKLEAGQMEVNPISVDIAEFIEQTIEPLKLWADTEEIAIEQQTGVTRAVFDPELTSRVLVNLLSNALKYSPPKSRIRIIVEPYGSGLRMGVKDQGPGIPADFLPDLFKPFHMAKGSKSGSGLGLAFCRLAVVAQGGRIWAESHVGKGTSMYFTLPVGMSGVAAPVNSPADPNAANRDISQSGPAA